MSRPGASVPGAKPIGDALSNPDLRQPMPLRQLIPIFIATFTLYLAFIAPTSYSLAVRIEALDPVGKDAVLPLAIGIPGLLTIVLSPVKGMLSDRTRSRLGRRRPWMLGGAILGVAGSVYTGVTPSVGGVIGGWCVAYIGYVLCASMITAYWGDKLPESQRGKVMGINGALTNIAPILGFSIAATFSSMHAAMFIVPGIIAFAGALVFVIAAKDPQFTGDVPKFDLKVLARGFYFDPRKHRDLGWVWISRAMVFVGVSVLSLYTVYLLGSRLGMDAGQVGALVASLGLAGVICGVVGAVGSGWLSDMLATRKPFLFVSAALLALALVLIGTTTSLAQFVVGNLLGSLAIGIYGAVDQAIALDTIPHEENQNGRYLSIFGLANGIPQAIGPLFAGAIVSVTGDYGWVYAIGGAFALAGAFLILPVKTRPSRRQEGQGPAQAHADATRTTA